MLDFQEFYSDPKRPTKSYCFNQQQPGGWWPQVIDLEIMRKNTNSLAVIMSPLSRDLLLHCLKSVNSSGETATSNKISCPTSIFRFLEEVEATNRQATHLREEKRVNFHVSHHESNISGAGLPFLRHLFKGRMQLQLQPLN